MRIRIPAAFCAAAILLSLPLPSGGQWKDLGGPGGCGIQALAANGSYLFAGTAFGVFVSTDEGGTWAAAGEVGSAALGNASVDRFYTSGPDLFALACRGILLSRDNGASWEPANTGLPDDPGVLCFLEVESVLYCGLYQGGIYRSMDRGAHWMPAGAGLPEDVEVMSLAAMGEVLYAGFEYDQGIYCSGDGGVTWAPLDPQLPDEAYARFLVVNGGRLLAGTSGDGIFMIEEGGRAWTKIEADWDEDGDIYFFASRGPGLLVNIEDKAYLSMDGGKIWREIEVGSSPDGVSISCFAASGPRLFVGTDGSGLFRSDDLGMTWIPVNAGFPSRADIAALARIGSDLFAASGEWGKGGSVYLRSEAGAGWEAAGLTLPEETDINCLEAVGTDLLAGTESGIFLSEDRGRTWSLVTPEQSDRPYVNGFAVDGLRILAGTNDGILLSTDRGRTWVRVFPEAEYSEPVDCFVRAGPALFAGGFRGVLVSRDRGGTWQRVNAGLPKGARCVALASDGKVIVAGITPPEDGKDQEFDAEGNPVIEIPDDPKYALFVSSDEGRSWTAAKPALTEPFKVSCLAASGSGFVAALEGYYLKAGRHCLGLFLSTDGGRSWTEEWPGQWTAAPINSFLVDKDEILAATKGAGVWRMPLSALKKRAP